MNVHVMIMTGPLPRDATDPPFKGAGAVLRFDGVVRPHENGRAIAALEYTAYEPMASRVMCELGCDVLERFGLSALLAEHSRGRVGVGECAFRLRIASVHRREGLLAMAEFLDRLKHDVPIWKSAVFVEAVAPGKPAATALVEKHT